MARIDALLFKALLSSLGFGSAAIAEDLSDSEPFTLVSGGAIVGTGIVRVVGRFNHALQISTIDGSDSYKLQGRIGSGPFVDIVKDDVTATMTADGFFRFSSVVDDIKVVKNSGTGTASFIQLRSRF
jgi:hypothetical protein